MRRPPFRRAIPSALLALAPLAVVACGAEPDPVPVDTGDPGRASMPPARAPEIAAIVELAADRVGRPTTALVRHPRFEEFVVDWWGETRADDVGGADLGFRAGSVPQAMPAVMMVLAGPANAIAAHDDGRYVAATAAADAAAELWGAFLADTRDARVAFAFVHVELETGRRVVTIVAKEADRESGFVGWAEDWAEGWAERYRTSTGVPVQEIRTTFID